MNYLNILYSVLTSTLVVGIATYSIQKFINKRFNTIEEFQRTLLSIRKEHHDTLLKTLQEVWEVIIDTKYYLKFDLNKQLGDAHSKNLEKFDLDSKPLLEMYILIEKRSILLPPFLSEATKDFFINNFQNTFNHYIVLLNQALKKQITSEEPVNFLNSALGENFEKELQSLRKMFEEQATLILEGKRIE